MGIIKRQGLKSSIVNYLGVLIGVVFFILIFPHIVPKEYLGLISLLQYLMYFFASVSSLGVSNILLRYFSEWEKKEPEKINEFNAFALFVIIIALFIVSILYVTFHFTIIEYYKNQSALFVPYFYVVIPLIVFFTLNQYFENFALVNLRSAVPAFLREVLNRVILIVVVYLFAYKILDEKQFVWSLTLAYAIPLFILLFYAIKILGFKTANPFKYLKNNSSLKSQLLYGGGLFLLGIFSTVYTFLDGIILPAYLGLGALGIYFRPLVLGQMIQVPYRAIGLIASPIIREAFVQNDLKKVKQLNRDISINLLLIGCFLFTLLIANTDNIFLLLPQEFSIAKNVLFIIGLGRLLDMAFGLNSEIISYSNKYKYVVILSGIMMLMTIGLNMLLIPIYGMNGAALAVSISLVVFNILKTILIYKKFHFICFSKHYITLIAITIFVIGILYFIPYIKFLNHHMFFNPILNIAFKSTIGVILFLVPTYMFNISPDFNDFFKLVISGKILKGGHKMENL